MHSADVSAREQFAFSEEQVRQILTELVQKDGISGAVLLATCNRTELYLSVQERRSSAEDDAVRQWTSLRQSSCGSMPMHRKSLLQGGF